MSPIRSLLIDGLQLAKYLFLKEVEEEKEENTKWSLKFIEASGVCWPGYMHLRHQIFFFVSKPLWICCSSEDLEFASFDFLQIDSNLGIFCNMKALAANRFPPHKPTSHEVFFRIF